MVPGSQSPVSGVRLIHFTTILTFCSLYAAQPIQPVFQAEFHLTSLQAILFTTLMMAPLGVAPLFYGVLLESYSARKLLRSAVLMLGLLELVFASTSNYLVLLVIRGVQGLMIPAILTSLMSYISYTSPPEKVQHSIAMYIGTTIMGGFLGRFLSGLCTDLFGWRFFFYLLGCLLTVAFVLLGALEKDIKTSYIRPSFGAIVALLKNPCFRWIYCAIFSLFFVFAAVMNFLPFELRNLDIRLGETGVGLLYLGYASGVVISMNSRRIIGLFGNETRAIIMGILVLAVGTLCFMVERYLVMFGSMFVFCSGLFLAHSLLSGYVNKLASTNKAVANGMYISFYYTGGTFGSFVPGIVFEYFGWRPFLLVLLTMVLVALIFVLVLHRAVKG